MSIRNLLALCALAMAAAANANPTAVAIAKVVAEGKNRNQAPKLLKTLTSRFGPRLTGSPSLHQAQKWAVAQFKSWGIQNARLEKWGEVPVGFERGRRQIGRMVAPYQADLTFTTMNWTPGTRGKVRGKAIAEPKTMDEVEKAKDRLKGAWVVMSQTAGIRGTERNDDAKVREAINAAGIAGRIYGNADHRVRSHGNWRDKSFENRPKEVEVFVSKADMDRIKSNLEKGQDVVLEFDIENKWFKGPIPQYNVIADIVGTEKPDEMVIVCGHFDSWNSPGSQGASDNGTGSTVAMEAARILMKSGVKPKRTIRFILWSGEEQGLLGSRAYVEMHKNELDKVSAVLNDDGGSNYQGGYIGLEIMRPMMEAAFAPAVAAFPEMPQQFNVVEKMPDGGSSDHAPFNWQGVPGFFTLEKGRQDYGYVWHTQYDRFENAIPEYMVQSSTNHAVVALSLANAETLLPRGPKPAPRPPLTASQLNHALAVGADHMYEDPNGLHDHEDDYVLERLDQFKRILRFIARGSGR